MLRNYLNITLRNFLKNRAFTLINISGLVLGIATCVLISLFVLHELSYDNFHDKSERVFRLTEILHLPKEDRPQAVTSPPMAPALKTNFPEVENTVRLSGSSRIVSVADKKFYDTQVWYADSTFFDIFSFPMLRGNPAEALVEPYSIVLTEKAAKRYFGDADALGKEMSLSDSIPLRVTGLIADIPSNSHIQFDVLLSRSTISDMNNYEVEDNWFNNGTYTYILLPEGYDHKNLEAKFPAFLEKHLGEVRREYGLWYDLVLEPLSQIHLNPLGSGEMRAGGNIRYIYTFSTVAILVLLIACANYINLSTAKSMNRAKELGMRKVMGAHRKQLITQLLGESFFTAIIAFTIAVALVMAMLPSFNLLTGKTLSITYLLTSNVLFTMFAIFSLVGILAGLYPAILMSSYMPARIIKGLARQSKENVTLRKVLVVFQFAMSVTLIAGTTLIFRQIEFLQSRDLGLHKDQIVQLGLSAGVQGKYELIQNELRKVPGVLSSTASNFGFVFDAPNLAVLPEGAQETEVTSEATYGVDFDFLNTFDIQLVAGRDFSKAFATDNSEAFILNEAAVKAFNWATPENAIGKKLDWGLGKEGRVIGVVKNFNFESLHQPIRPLIIHIHPLWYSNISVKIASNNMEETLAALEKTWKSLDLDGPFEYSFMDQDFKRQYEAEQRTRTIIGTLTFLAILIACLGLFGLAAFTAEQRAKEIGIRKVLGAEILNIVRLLSIDFIKPIVVAIAIAIPTAWYATDRWLNGFAYKVELSWWIFAFAGGSAILIAFFTVSFHSIKAAITNPVDSLRNE